MIWLLWIVLGLVGVVVGIFLVAIIACAIEDWQKKRKLAKARHPDKLTTRDLLAVAEKDWKREYEALVIEVEECIGCLHRARRAREMWREKMRDRGYRHYGLEPAELREMSNKAKATSQCPRHQHNVAEWW